MPKQELMGRKQPGKVFAKIALSRIREKRKSPGHPHLAIFIWSYSLCIAGQRGIGGRRSDHKTGVGDIFAKQIAGESRCVDGLPPLVNFCRLWTCAIAEQQSRPASIFWPFAALRCLSVSDLLGLRVGFSMVFVGRVDGLDGLDADGYTASAPFNGWGLG